MTGHALDLILLVPTGLHDPCQAIGIVPVRRREGAMANFRDIKTLQKFAAVHASVHNHFNFDRHLNRRDIFKQNRSAALAEWRQLAA
jgi:putative transposase